MARLILALADSKSFSAVEAELNTSRPTTARWKARFERAGSRDSKARHKGSRVREATPDVQARLLRKTQQKPGDDSTHWSCRKMAAAIGQSPATVYRIWSKTSLNPHRVDRYMASKDSAFEEKTAEIVGLYMEPPQHAALSCVDEKTAIQAMNRLDPSCRYLRGALKSTDSNTSTQRAVALRGAGAARSPRGRCPPDPPCNEFLQGTPADPLIDPVIVGHQDSQRKTSCKRRVERH